MHGSLRQNASNTHHLIPLLSTVQFPMPSGDLTVIPRIVSRKQASVVLRVFGSRVAVGYTARVIHFRASLLTGLRQPSTSFPRARPRQLLPVRSFSEKSAPWAEAHVLEPRSTCGASDRPHPDGLAPQGDTPRDRRPTSRPPQEYASRYTPASSFLPCQRRPDLAGGELVSRLRT